jgi:hypothetical protein
MEQGYGNRVNSRETVWVSYTALSDGRHGRQSISGRWGGTSDVRREIQIASRGALNMKLRIGAKVEGLLRPATKQPRHSKGLPKSCVALRRLRAVILATCLTTLERPPRCKHGKRQAGISHDAHACCTARAG